jgi:hypothetical protein
VFVDSRPAKANEVWQMSLDVWNEWSQSHHWSEELEQLLIEIQRETNERINNLRQNSLFKFDKPSLIGALESWQTENKLGKEALKVCINSYFLHSKTKVQ